MNSARSSGPDSLAVARRWLEALAAADFAAWPTLVAADVTMEFPFAPPGLPDRCVGRADCERLIRTFFAGIRQFRWHDLRTHPMLDPELVFATARSEVVLSTGRPYSNNYCFFMRIRAGLLTEYREYFNALLALEAVQSVASGAGRSA